MQVHDLGNSPPTAYSQTSTPTYCAFFFQMHASKKGKVEKLLEFAKHQLCPLYIKHTYLWITCATIRVNHITNFITNFMCLGDDELQCVPKQPMSATLIQDINSHDQWQPFDHCFTYCPGSWRQNMMLQSHHLSIITQCNHMLVSQCILKQQNTTCKHV